MQFKHRHHRTWKYVYTLKGLRNNSLDQRSAPCTDLILTGADPNLRDWSGRKPRQYQVSQDTSVSADTFRSEYLSNMMSKIKLPTNPPSAANNIYPKIQKHRHMHHSFLRRSFRPKSEGKNRSHSIPATLYNRMLTWL
jgi:hypothetical protein